MLHKVYKVLYNSCLSFLLSLLKSLQFGGSELGRGVQLCTLGDTFKNQGLPR